MTLRSARARVSLAALASLAAVALGGTAHANGRFPTAQQVVVGAGEHARRVTFRVTFGPLVSDAGAWSLQWRCEEAYQAEATARASSHGFRVG